MAVDAIAAFRAARPQTAFVINQANAAARWDVRVKTVLAGAAVGAKGAHAFRERVCLAVPRERVGESGSVALADFAEAPFVALAGSRAFRAVCDELCSQVGFAPNVAFESDSPDVVRKFIALGLGVGFWPERSWGALEGSDVVLAPIADAGFARDIVVETAKHPLGQKAAEFHAFLLEFIRRRMGEADA